MIEIQHRHDFRRCKCEAIFIDSGLDCGRYGAKNLDDIIPMHEYEYSKDVDDSQDPTQLP